MTARVRGGVVALLVTLMALPGEAASVRKAETLLQAWQLEDALALGQQLLTATPDDPEVWALAGKIQHQRGEHRSALALFEGAVKAGMAPQDIGYVFALAMNSAAYEAHFETLETEHFKIRYLNKDEIVATYAAPVLEAAYRNIGADLDFYPAERGEKIAVEIYPDARGLAGATGLTVEEIETSGTIAVCKFHRLMITSPLATTNGYGWADTLAHEYLHLVISKKSSNTIPIWLHEGIAKYYESRWSGDAGRALSPYAEKLLADATRKQKFITYEEMHPSMAKLPSQKAAALAFAEVFTTIEFLVNRFGHSAIRELLVVSGTGVPLESALKRAFGMGLKGIERAWRRYLKNRDFRIVPGAKPRPIRLASNEEEAATERALETMDDREVHEFSRLGELLQLRGHHAAAIIEYEKAYARSGVRYVTLLSRLAKAYVADNRVEDALTMLDKGLRAHPESGDSHLLAGRIRLRQGDLIAAQGHFEAVRLQNPFNPEIHEALQALYARQGKTTAAEQERRFLDLSRKPRPTRTYALPTPPAGAARVRIVTPQWTQIRIGGRPPIATPAWDVAVEPGVVRVEVLNIDGVAHLEIFEVKPGETKTVVLSTRG